MSEHAQLQALQRMIQVARDELDNKDFQAPMLLILLEIAKPPSLTEGPVSMTELEKRLGVSQGAVSRTVAKLGRGISSKDPGLGLVTAREREDYRRQKVCELTSKGRQVVSKILKAGVVKGEENAEQTGRGVAA